MIEVAYQSTIINHQSSIQWDVTQLGGEKLTQAVSLRRRLQRKLVLLGIGTLTKALSAPLLLTL
jgi:hypothetical protein